MTIEAGLYDLMSNSEIKSPYDVDELDFVLNLEVLTGCDHHCDGCYVNRRNGVDKVDLDKALQLAKDMTERGLRFREVILSPTDIFSSENAEEVLLDSRFQELLTLHPKTRITTTAMLTDTSMDDIRRLFKLFDNPEYFRDDMILEFLVPMDPEKVLNRDDEYIAHMNEVTEFFRNETPKVVDWSFVLNVHYNPLYWNNVDEITEYARDDYGTIIEFLPSFFRTGKGEMIESLLRSWNELVEVTVNEDNYKEIMLTVADKYHNTNNTIVMNYRNHELFISPFIYEQVLVTADFYKVEDMTADAVMRKSQEMTIQQYRYMASTTSCSSCDHNATCVGRNVLSFMEEREIKDCIYPLDTIKLYHGFRPLTPRLIRCSNV